VWKTEAKEKEGNREGIAPTSRGSAERRENPSKQWVWVRRRKKERRKKKKKRSGRGRPEVEGEIAPQNRSRPRRIKKPQSHHQRPSAHGVAECHRPGRDRDELRSPSQRRRRQSREQAFRSTSSKTATKWTCSRAIHKGDGAPGAYGVLRPGAPAISVEALEGRPRRLPSRTS